MPRKITLINYLLNLWPMFIWSRILVWRTKLVKLVLWVNLKTLTNKKVFPVGKLVFSVERKVYKIEPAMVKRLIQSPFEDFNLRLECDSTLALILGSRPLLAWYRFQISVILIQKRNLLETWWPNLIHCVCLW